MKKILLLILFSFMFMSFHNIASIRPKVEENDVSFLKAKELNDSILYLALIHYNIRHPKIVLAQAKLESGNFTSSHYKKRNNFLGLYDSKRKEYYKFNHWTDCIQGYKDMVEYKLRDNENYYNFLRRIKYATSENYIRQIKQIEKSI